MHNFDVTHDIMHAWRMEKDKLEIQKWYLVKRHKIYTKMFIMI